MRLHRKIALVYAVVLFSAAASSYVPGLKDAEGRTFGIFALDIFDDGLHLVSGLWALAAVLVSARAARIFLTVFGALYLADGALGLFTGSGYLDLGIINHGVLDLPFGFKVLANLPHVGLGGFALFAGLRLDRN